MQSLQFKKIRICSELEQKALSLEFHPHKTLILGSNSTGKSTIIKSLFRAFDAEPTGELRGWDYGAIIAVDFTVGGKSYTSLRKGDLRALFSGHQLLGVTTSSLEWNDIFSNTVDFKLKLIDQEENFRAASPSIFFMPFYINQDGSFFSKWDTFKSIKQFDSNAITHTLEYFARVRPELYFEIKGNERILKSDVAELSVETSILAKTRRRLSKTLKASPVKLTAAGFEKEVHELSRRATELGSKQDRLRKDIVESQELANQIVDQIRLSNAALKEHEADFKTAGSSTDDLGEFRCPTCHATHDASFHNLLGLAEDAREVYRMKQILESNLSSVKDRITKYKRDASALKQEYVEVSNLLAAKKGRLTFEDVVKSYGADAADSALEQELNKVNNDIASTNVRLNELKAQLSELMASHDSDAPIKKFRAHFQELLSIVDVQAFEDIDTWKLNKRPNDSGSPGPRSVIAYYGALWSTIQNEKHELPSPLVIDSPNQNAQDRANLVRVMAVLANKTPKDAQVILCAEEMSDEFDADFTIILSEKRNLLHNAYMSKVSAEVFPLVELAIASLAGIRIKPN